MNNAIAGAIDLRPSILKERYRRLYEENPVPQMVRSISSNRIISANQAACAYYGYALEEFLELTPLALYPETLHQYIQKNYDEGHVALGEFDTVHLKADGSAADVRITVSAISWDNEAANMISAQELSQRAIDPTLAASCALAMMQSEKRYQTVFNENQTPMFIIGKQQPRKIVAANKAACRFYGFPHEVLLGMAALDLYPEAQRADREATLRSTDRDEATSFEAEQLMADGTCADVHVTLVTVPWNGAPAELKMVQDVSARNALQTVAKERAEALEQSEFRYRRMFEDNLTPMLVSNADRVFVDVNRAACNYYGYAREAFLRLSAFDLYPRENHAALKKLIARFEDGEPGQFDTLHIKADGSTADVHVSLLSIPWNNSPARLVMVQDLSERNEVLRKLKSSNDLFRTAQRIGKFGDWALNLQTREAYWSDELFELFGRSKEAGAPSGTSPFREYFSGEDNVRLDLCVASALLGELNQGGDFELLHADGSTVWIRVDIAAEFDESGVAARLMGTMHDISAHKNIEAKLAQQARVDALTGLPNRIAAAEALKIALTTASRSSLSPAVLFIDVDDFKNVNDTLGHTPGDNALIEISQRLRKALHPFDFVARMGGDEFAVILSDMTDPARIAAVAESLQSLISRPIEVLPQHNVVLTVTIGIAMYPQHGRTVESLIMNADTAMYHSKRDTRASYRFFSPHMHAAAEEKLHLGSAIRKGLEHNSFSVHYQPIVSATGALVACEALARWPQENGSVLMPDAFIPFAEECGLIVPLGRWVLSAACEQAAAWNATSGVPMRMCVNVSAKQLADPAFVQTVLDVLATSGLPPALLELEFTETAIARSPEQACKVAQRLRAVGVRIALDDFGTGYNSLVNLRSLPIDTLKLDRCFVKEIEENTIDRAIAAAVISAARTLGATALAEGVETAAQRAILQDLGIDELQGYLYARPTSADAMQRFIAATLKAPFRPMLAA